MCSKMLGEGLVTSDQQKKLTVQFLRVRGRIMVLLPSPAGEGLGGEVVYIESNTATQCRTKKLY